jgi:REP-associated tyrosine transposase
MSQSLSNILVHVIFSTKNRAPWLSDSWRERLHSYIGGIVRGFESELLAINSVEDHLHLLLTLPRIECIADIVKEIKTGSTLWIHKRNKKLAVFRWQAGYGAFSISPSHKRALQKYISNQAEHHRKVSFQEEYRRVLKKYEIEFDERYVWD